MYKRECGAFGLCPEGASTFERLGGSSTLKVKERAEEKVKKADVISI